MHAQSRTGRFANGLDALLVRGSQSHEGARCTGGTSGSFNADKEKAQPGFPVARKANGLEQFVILLAVLFEVEAKIKQRQPERSFRTEQKSYEQATQPPVAVQKGVNGFKLHVSQGSLITCQCSLHECGVISLIWTKQIKG
jgi:hypothetical protein